MGSKGRRPRTKRQAEKWKRELDRFRMIQRQIKEDAPDILASGNFRRTREYIQHGNTVHAVRRE